MPQPIDMQSEVTRVTMAERMQDAATRSSLAAMQRASKESQEDDELHETQVNETKEAEKAEVEADGRRKNPFTKRSKKKAHTSESEESHTVYTAGETKEILDDPDDHGLDITV